MKITLLIGQTFDISEDVGMDIKVIRSLTSRKLILRIDRKERMPVLSVPKYCSRKKAVDFVNENMDWIVKNLNKLPIVKHFTDGESISLFGESLKITHCPNARRGVWKEENRLCVSGGIEFLHRRVRDYIKSEAQKEFFKISKELADKIQCNLHNVTIKDTKSRWGSCSSLNNINYSWRIALAPREVIHYLMAHEVAHLKHQDHSKAFWACVCMLYPEWSRGFSWLKKHGCELYAYQ